MSSTALTEDVGQLPLTGTIVPAPMEAADMVIAELRLTFVNTLYAVTKILLLYIGKKILPR
jgi:hypothetical protein